MFYEHVFECRCVQKNTVLIQWCSERKAWSTQTKTFIKKHSVWLLIQWKSSASGEFCGKSARLDALEPSVLYIYANLIFFSLHLRTQRLIVLCLCSEENREMTWKSIHSFVNELSQTKREANNTSRPVSVVLPVQDLFLKTFSSGTMGLLIKGSQ